MLGLQFAYATNGAEIIEFDYFTGLEKGISAYPAPDELWKRYRAGKSLKNDSEVQQLLTPINFTLRQGERYYQEIAITANLTTQHQATRNMLKPMVRILKNMRNRLIQDGSIANGIAPSYFIEGMLYNVLAINFVSTYGGAFCNCINWLSNADRSTLVCPNRQYLLLGHSNIQWPPANCDAFLDALMNFWNNW